MPQELQVVRCYNCKTFQVHIVSSRAKWDCKMCGAKQSYRKVYAKGSGHDCRLHVQYLNEMSLRGYEEFVRDHENTVEDRFAREPFGQCFSPYCCTSENGSKWSQFMEVADVEDTNDISQPSKFTSERQIVEPMMGNNLLDNNASNAYKEEVVRPQNPFVSAAAYMQNKDSENIDQRKRKPEDVRDNFQSFENTEGKDSQANIPSLPKLTRKEDYTSDELDNILSF